MCIGCFEEYEEEHGPAVFSEAARAVARLIDLQYKREPVGGRLHVVLDDSNIEDEHIEHCLSKRVGKDKLTSLERSIARKLLAMSMQERNAAVHWWEARGDERIERTV